MRRETRLEEALKQQDREWDHKKELCELTDGYNYADNNCDHGDDHDRADGDGDGSDDDGDDDDDDDSCNNDDE